MKFEVESNNKQFGALFSLILFFISIVFYVKQIYLVFIILILISFAFSISAIFFSNILTPLNKLWMKFGLILSKIVSPIFIGLIFFLIISPVAIFTRMFGRDELKLKKKPSASFWQKKLDDYDSSFKNQF